jgi:predicted Rossmann fold nucleotide-binding protein DprA/Smf involved in DNA uptake
MKQQSTTTPSSERDFKQQNNSITEATIEIPKKVGIVGTRRFSDYKRFKELILPVLENIEYDTIVSGGAKGIDTLARRLANEKNLKMIEFSSGKKSPLKRNTKIAITSDIIIAMPDSQSTGTLDTIRKATKMGKTVIKIKV